MRSFREIAERAHQEFGRESPGVGVIEHELWENLKRVQREAAQKGESVEHYVAKLQWSPRLIHAVKLAGDSWLSRLLGQQADFNRVDAEGWTPVHRAVPGARTDMLQALAEVGGDFTKPGPNGETPAHLAADVNSDIVDVVRQAGGDFQARDHQGRTPAHIAALGRGLNPCVRYDPLTILAVARAGADVRAPDNVGETPAHYAPRHSVDMVRLVAHAGGDFTSRDKRGRTPAHVAASVPDGARVRAVKEAGGDFSVADNDGVTPTHQAVLTGSAEHVRAVHAAGGTFLARDRAGKLPVDYAFDYAKGSDRDVTKQALHELIETVTQVTEHERSELRKSAPLSRGVENPGHAGRDQQDSKTHPELDESDDRSR